MDQVKVIDESQLRKDVTELKAKYNMERDALVKAPTQPDRYGGQWLENFDRLVAIDGLLKALNNIVPDPPETKVVLYLDEDGTEKERRLDRVKFDMWLSEIGSLVKLTSKGSRRIQVGTFDEVDEFSLYCLERRPVDKDRIQTNIDEQKLLFGKACEKLVLKDFPGFHASKRTGGAQGGEGALSKPLRVSPEGQHRGRLLREERKGSHRWQVPADDPESEEYREIL